VPFAADVIEEGTLAAAVEAARARWGRIDILHNNVGISLTPAKAGAHGKSRSRPSPGKREGDVGLYQLNECVH
jgi:NAD(P)-dependent dehydrogenase (short-subunit alcohol dehydrogenase family)